MLSTHPISVDIHIAQITNHQFIVYSVHFQIQNNIVLMAYHSLEPLVLDQLMSPVFIFKLTDRNTTLVASRPDFQVMLGTVCQTNCRFFLLQLSYNYKVEF